MDHQSLGIKRVLITGGAGFIGSNLALKLIGKGYEVAVLDNLSPQIHGEADSSFLYNSIRGKVNFIHGDVAKEEDWLRSLDDQQAIIHLAAETGTGQSMYEIKRYMDVNVMGTAIMLDYLANKEHYIKRVVVASSRAIYGEGKYWSEAAQQHVYPESRVDADMSKGDFEPKCPLTGSDLELCATDENSKAHASSIYGLTKYNQEQAVLIACAAIGVEAVAFRPQNVYGPGQSLKNPYTGILSIFSNRIRAHKEINIFEDGKESRDFIYIDDMVDALVLGLEHPAAANQIYNAGNGVQTSVLEVANQLIKNYGIEVPVNITGQYRLGDIRHNYADLTKIKTELGFEPKVDFNEGISRFTQWVMDQEIEEDRYEASLNEMKAKGLLK